MADLWCGEATGDDGWSGVCILALILGVFTWIMGPYCFVLCFCVRIRVQVRVLGHDYKGGVGLGELEDHDRVVVVQLGVQEVIYVADYNHIIRRQSSRSCSLWWLAT